MASKSDTQSESENCYVSFRKINSEMGRLLGGEVGKGNEGVIDFEGRR